MPDINIGYRLMGTKIPLERVGDMTLRAALDKAGREARRKLSKLACPNHDGMLLVEIHGQGAETVNYWVRACCEEFSSKVMQALK